MKQKLQTTKKISASVVVHLKVVSLWHVKGKMIANMEDGYIQSALKHLRIYQKSKLMS
jgi:hypothetical protein